MMNAFVKSMGAVVLAAAVFLGSADRASADEPWFKVQMSLDAIAKEAKASGEAPEEMLTTLAQLKEQGLSHVRFAVFPDEENVATAGVGLIGDAEKISEAIVSGKEPMSTVFESAGEGKVKVKTDGAALPVPGGGGAAAGAGDEIPVMNMKVMEGMVLLSPEGYATPDASKLGIGILPGEYDRMVALVVNIPENIGPEMIDEWAGMAGPLLGEEPQNQMFLMIGMNVLKPLFTDLKAISNMGVGFTVSDDRRFVLDYVQTMRDASKAEAMAKQFTDGSAEAGGLAGEFVKISKDPNIRTRAMAKDGRLMTRFDWKESDNAAVGQAFMQGMQGYMMSLMQGG